MFSSDLHILQLMRLVALQHLDAGKKIFKIFLLGLDLFLDSSDLFGRLWLLVFIVGFEVILWF